MTEDNIEKKLFDIFIINCKGCNNETEHYLNGPFINEHDRKNNPQMFTEKEINSDMYTCLKCENSSVYDRRTVERKETSLVYDNIKREVKKKE